MCGRCGERISGRRSLFPEQTPPGLNYAVVTGTLLDDPKEGGGPGGTPVLIMEIEFPVADPEHPRLLWTYASYEVEVPGDVGGRHVEGLRKATRPQRGRAVRGGSSRARTGRIVYRCMGAAGNVEVEIQVACAELNKPLAGQRPRFRRVVHRLRVFLVRR